MSKDIDGRKFVVKPEKNACQFFTDEKRNKCYAKLGEISSHINNDWFTREVAQIIEGDFDYTDMDFTWLMAFYIGYVTHAVRVIKWSGTFNQASYNQVLDILEELTEIACPLG
jgi:hypothetical protein